MEIALSKQHQQSIDVIAEILEAYSQAPNKSTKYFDSLTIESASEAFTKSLLTSARKVLDGKQLKINIEDELLFSIFNAIVTQLIVKKKAKLGRLGCLFVDKEGNVNFKPTAFLTRVLK